MRCLKQKSSGVGSRYSDRFPANGIWRSMGFEVLGREQCDFAEI